MSAIDQHLKLEFCQVLNLSLICTGKVTNRLLTLTNIWPVPFSQNPFVITMKLWTKLSTVLCQIKTYFLKMKQDSSKYSGWSEQCCGLNGINSSLFQIPSVSILNLWKQFQGHQLQLISPSSPTVFQLSDKIWVVVSLFPFFHFPSMVCWNSKIPKMTSYYYYYYYYYYYHHHYHKLKIDMEFIALQCFHIFNFNFIENHGIYNKFTDKWFVWGLKNCTYICYIIKE